jgi:hypothetical protein
MKTLYLTQSSENIVIDPETNFVGKLEGEDRYCIRGIYYMEEPMHIVYQCGETREELDARKGDIVLVFYSNRYNKYTIDTIRTKQWAANIKAHKAGLQAEREEWAKQKAENSCSDCDTCESCANLAETPVVDAAPAKESVGKKIRKALKKVTKK